MKKYVVCSVMTLLLAASCNRGGSTPKAASAAVARLTTPQQAAVVITDEKVKGYLVYMREMSPATAKWMKSGKLTGDEQMKAMQKASEEALKKAGITMSDMQSLSLLTGEYFGQALVGRDAEKALAGIAQRKADGKPGLGDKELVEVHQNTMNEFQKVRADYVKKYGESAVQVLDKYADEFNAIMLAGLGKPDSSK